MVVKRRVVLYGNTLVLAAVGRTLSTHRGLRIISLDPSQATALGDLDSLRPCTLILDLTEVTPERAVGLVQGRPDLMLIGLEPSGEGLLVLSGEQARALTTDDLVRLIETRVLWAGQLGETNDPADAASTCQLGRLSR
jgi:hypothetical protein